MDISFEKKKVFTVNEKCICFHLYMWKLHPIIRNFLCRSAASWKVPDLLAIVKPGPEESRRRNQWSTELKDEAFKYIMARGFTRFYQNLHCFHLSAKSLLNLKQQYNVAKYNIFNIKKKEHKQESGNMKNYSKLG